MTLQTLRTLSVFIADPARELSGTDVMKMSGMFSGTLYPLLIRLEEARWLHSRWEKIDPAAAGRPRRRLYRVTAVGQRVYAAEQRLFGVLA